MHFMVEWPDGERVMYYSPSYVVEDELSVQAEYPVGEFLERASRALQVASERVRAKYGFACSSALDELARIEAAAGVHARDPQARVRVLAFQKHPPRDARATAKASSGHFPVIVIGGGQAGLSVSYCLKEHGIDHRVLERSRVGSAWRDERWSSFCLVTPNWQCQLPGHPYAGPDPKGFMGREAIVEYIESYVASFQPPLSEGVEVTSLAPSRVGEGFGLETSSGFFTADHVVVATGAYHKPRVPAFARELPADILQLHSASYRHPDALPPGDVLVVGTGQSGCQIAEDLHLAGRRVHLCVGNAPRCARRYRGKDVVEWLHEMGYYDLPIDEHPNKEQVRDKTNHYVTGRDGGHDIDLRAFALQGMKLYGPLDSIRDGVARFAPGLKRHLDEADEVYRSINRSIDAFIAKSAAPCEGDWPPSEYVAVWEPESETPSLDVRSAGIRSVVWCTGFDTDFSWVKAPVFDETGRVRHERGVTAVPGLYFIGLPWLFTWGSGRFSGVGRDARHIVARILLAATASVSTRA
jgi:putative flavoprotein involved in K+ transport